MFFFKYVAKLCQNRKEEISYVGLDNCLENWAIIMRSIILQSFRQNAVKSWYELEIAVKNVKRKTFLTVKL